MIEVTLEGYNNLSETEKDNASDNGSGKEYACYIRIKHNGATIVLESDAVEPEDATFGRDFSWIIDALKKCYELGVADSNKSA